MFWGITEVPQSLALVETSKEFNTIKTSKATHAAVEVKETDDRLVFTRTGFSGKQKANLCWSPVILNKNKQEKQFLFWRKMGNKD
jgi:hypothetical protein